MEGSISHSWFKVQAVTLKEGSISRSWFKVQAVTLREGSISHSWFKVQAVTLREGSSSRSWFKVQAVTLKGQSLTFDSRFKESLWEKGQSVTLDSRFKQSLWGGVNQSLLIQVSSSYSDCLNHESELLLYTWSMVTAYPSPRMTAWPLNQWLLDPWIRVTAWTWTLTWIVWKT